MLHVQLFSVYMSCISMPLRIPMSLLIPPGYCTNLRCTVFKTGAAIAVTEVSAPNSKPRLFPHKISI